MPEIKATLRFLYSSGEGRLSLAMPGITSRRDIEGCGGRKQAVLADAGVTGGIYTRLNGARHVYYPYGLSFHVAVYITFIRRRNGVEDRLACYAPLI